MASCGLKARALMKGPYFISSSRPSGTEMMNRKHKILVVDDEPAIHMAITEVLMYEGYDVRSATNGRDALAILREWCPDVVVLDLAMPVMNGFEFRQAQLQLPNDSSQIPIVVLSGTRNVHAHATAIGAVASIAKPFNLDDVVETIGEVLQHSH